MKYRKLFSSDKLNSSSNTNINVITQKSNGYYSYSPSFRKGTNCHKFLWIRMALLKKHLTKIIESIISNADKFYVPNALLADPVDGPIFSSLLIGPCTLEFTRAKTCDYLLNDPNADELIQRHKMRSSGALVSSNLNFYTSTPVKTINAAASLQTIGSISENGDPLLLNNSSNLASIKNDSFGSYYKSKLKLGLNSSIISKRKASVSVLEDISNTNAQNEYSNSKLLTPHDTIQSSNSPSPLQSTSPSYYSAHTNSAKEYVESLHQNSKSQIIYGKNHVLVSHKETELAGYLSLHLNQNGLILKWTPNLLMNGSSASSLDEPSNNNSTTTTSTSPAQSTIINSKLKSYWEYALYIDINTIVYLHCHQQNSSGATVILVAQDGVQHPPIKFPKGSHLIQFLSCLENGLSPFGQLEPPLSKEIEKGNRIFPKVNQSKEPLRLNDDTFCTDNQSNNNPEIAVIDENNNSYETNLNDKDEDFVFRIVNSKSNGKLFIYFSNIKGVYDKFYLNVNYFLKNQ